MKHPYTNALFHERRKVLDPSEKRRMIDRHAALAHHFFKVAGIGLDPTVVSPGATHMSTNAILIVVGAVLFLAGLAKLGSSQIADLRREFIVECLRIAAVKASHAADNLQLGYDICAEHDLSVAISHIKEAASSFRAMGGNS